MGTANENGASTRAAAESPAFAERLERKSREEAAMLSEGLDRIRAGITGRQAGAPASPASCDLESALDCILSFYRVKKARKGTVGGRAAGAGGQARATAPGEAEVESGIEAQLESSGMEFRQVRLEGAWWKRSAGAMLGFTKEGAAVALLPRRGGYVYTAEEDGPRTRVDERAMQEVLDGRAYCFYRPLPARPLSLGDLVAHIASAPRRIEYVKALVAALIVAGVGAGVPYLNSLVYHIIVPNASQIASKIVPVAAAIGIAAASIAASRALFEANVQLVKARFSSMMKTDLCAAFMMRILSLPASFFRKHPAGELATRFSGLEPAVDAFLTLACDSGLAVVFMVVYIVQLGVLSAGMLWTCVLVVGATLAVNIAGSWFSARRTNRILAARAETSQVELSTICGMRKIRSAGAEKRAYARWARPYARQTMLSYGNPGPLVWSQVLTCASNLAGLLLLYACASAGGVDDGSDYMVFASSYALIQGCMTSVVASLAQVFTLKPHLDMLKPIMQAVPETAQGGEVVRDACGRIEMRHVSFAYERSVQVFHDLSLDVQPGAYVGIVGKSGCGKSTLLRLLLGFERPDLGSVCFDGRDLSTLDCERLRRDAFGVVLQDSRLFEGSIFDNVGVSCASLTHEQAWEALEVAGLADDVRKMKLGIGTFVGPDGCNLSGGQRQRVLVARAVASHPKVLLLDEATSALDNATQKKVADALARIGCTRIVVAHRLSTVRDCDRILVLEDGHIVEDGAYEELLARDGAFAELMRRQQL